MQTGQHAPELEQQISQWRSYAMRRQAIHRVDIAELEDHLREQVAGLVETGLSHEEAFLVAVKRMGALDELSREFAREHSERLWKQLVVASADPSGATHGSGRDALVAWGLGILAGVAIKVPSLFAQDLDQDGVFYARNLGFFVLPFLTLYFTWKRQLAPGTAGMLLAGFVVAALVVNLFPFISGGSTELLAVMHLPIALWLLVGIAYAGGRWDQVAGRMDFVRFSGELFIYFVLIALGGGVLSAFMVMIFQSIGLDAEPFFQNWLLPCGAMGAVLVASWLVEAKQSVIENMAPVLTRLFTPLFTAVLVVFLATVLLTNRGILVDREVLIAFDLLLALVLGLLLYSVSARDPQAPPGFFDWLLVVLVLCALLSDAVALWAIARRINEFGFTPNRVAAFGENVVLLLNLSWSAVLYGRFLRGRGTFAALERWQTNYLPVYAAWAAIVVLVFPPLFGYS